MFSGLFMYLIFLIFSFASGSFKKVPNQHKTKGTIDSLEQNNRTRKGMVTHTAVVSYVVGGRIYNIKTSYQSSFFSLGKKLVVYYEGGNPENSFVRAGILIYILMAASIVAGTMFIVKAIIDFIM